MSNSKNTSLIIALCGPSGVGKGITKEKIKHQSEFDFVEPIVATTRLARIGDTASRMTGINKTRFNELVITKSITLAHQPFRIADSPWYGFLASSFATDQPILTEVHSSIINRFHERFANRPILVIGMVALKSTLADNIFARQGTFDDGTRNDLRLAMMLREEQEIRDAFSGHLVHHLVSCNPDERNASQALVVSTIQEYYRKSA